MRKLLLRESWWAVPSAPGILNTDRPDPRDLSVFSSAAGPAQITDRHLPRVPSRSVLFLQTSSTEPLVICGPDLCTASRPYQVLGRELRVPLA